MTIIRIENLRSIIECVRWTRALCGDTAAIHTRIYSNEFFHKKIQIAENRLRFGAPRARLCKAYQIILQLIYLRSLSVCISSER